MVQSDLARLERDAARGVPVAIARLSNIANMLHRQPRVGRKAGTPNVYCTPEATLAENLSLARYGESSRHYAAESSATGEVEQLRIILDGDGGEFSYEGNGDQPAQPIPQDRREAEALRFMQTWIAPKMLKRFMACDADYFENFATDMRRPPDSPEQPRYVALLGYISWVLEQKPEHRFTRNELRDKVPWPKGYGEPDSRTLRRMIARLKAQIPM